jgi:plastocyanin
MAVRGAAVAWPAALAISCGLLALPLVALGATSAVTIQNSSFNPPTTPVRVGDTVTWTNRDTFSHTSTSDTGVWDTSVISAGGSRSFTFTGAGNFAYHCAIHSFMHGSVTVLAANTPPPTQPPSTPPPPPPPTQTRTAPPTEAPTEAPTPSSTTTIAPSATVSATTAPTETLAASASPSVVAVQLTPAPGATGGGPDAALVGAAAVALVILGAIAFFRSRRS